MVQLAMFYPDLRMVDSLTAVAAILVNHEFSLLNVFKVTLVICIVQLALYCPETTKNV